ncbi:MAG: hypothetical protein R3268_00750 [Acidiferrobacterales bacterium]|nr:hypothetical protein [Acidiferrobacterales bacterium]
MILFIWSVYVIFAGKYQLAKHYGVTGGAARLCGGFNLLVSLGLVGAIIPIADPLINFGVQFGMIVVIGFLAVAIHGNDFAKPREESRAIEAQISSRTPESSSTTEQAQAQDERSEFDDEWDTLLEYDADFQRAWAQVNEYGPRACAELKRAYSVVRDKGKIASIANTVREKFSRQAKAEEEARIRAKESLEKSSSDEENLSEVAAMLGLQIRHDKTGIALFREGKQVKFFFNANALREFLKSVAEHKSEVPR